MKTTILLFSILHAFHISAESRSPDAIKVPTLPFEMKAQMWHGGKVTLIHITKEKDKYKVAMSNNFGESAERILSPVNMNTLVAEFRKLPVPARIPNDCSRFRMDVVAKDAKGKMQNKSSCFGVATITEPKYTRFAKLLSLTL